MNGKVGNIDQHDSILGPQYGGYDTFFFPFHCFCSFSIRWTLFGIKFRSLSHFDLSKKKKHAELKTCGFSHTHRTYICHGFSSFILKTDSIKLFPCAARGECLRDPFAAYIWNRRVELFLPKHDLSAKIYHIIYFVWAWMFYVIFRHASDRRQFVMLFLIEML